MQRRGKVLVTGAGGFIGHHLALTLKRQGYWVRGIDLKFPEFSPTHAVSGNPEVEIRGDGDQPSPEVQPGLGWI